MTTLNQFLAAEQRRSGTPDADLVGLLQAIVHGCKVISHAVNQGALAGVLGGAGSDNVQGEAQKKLDVISNDVLIDNLQRSGYLAAMASEEMDEMYPIPSEFPRGNYLVMFDPLDGSSNIDVNISVGTIFSVLRARQAQAVMEDFLQPGTQQVCAGYALYGPSTMLVLTFGSGSHGFTLDTGSGEFMLTHPSMKIPAATKEFAINASNARFWEAPVKRYVDECVAGKNGPREQDFNMRWVASMVAEVHRILCRGGIFMYPIDSKTKDKGGRLRLMYEANPMSFIVEQAGGLASTGRQRILEVTPTGLHQRIAVILGSQQEVERVVEYHKQAE